MFQVLNGYLFQHKNISIPGLGTIYLETQPTNIDMANKNILPPQHSFRFDKYFDAPDKEFFAYLATQKKIADYEAIKWYTEFSYDLRDRIRHEEKVIWEGVGVLKKDLAGNIVFESTEGNPFFLGPVPAVPVNRGNTQHTILVGDKETTNTAMNEWLNDDSTPVRKWWLPALVAGIVAIIVLVIYFSTKGWQASSAANQQTLQVTK
jgi:hypothetical protein